MTAALIVIEMAAPQASDEALSVLVSACTRAAREAECVLAKNADEDQPAAVAIVSLQAEDKMRVEVGVHQGDHDSWRTKDFSFLAADEPLDRWRAIGFAIGTLAESDPPPEAQAEPRAPPPAPPPESAAPKAPPHVASKPKPKRGSELAIGAAAIFGPGLDSGPWRLGSELYVDFAPAGAPLFISLGGSAATRVTSDFSNASARWFDVSLGAGVPILGAPSHSGLELRAAVLTEYFDVAASNLGTSDTKNRWTFGVQGALGGRVRLVPNLFLTAQLQAAGFSGSTDVHVADVLVGTNANFRYLGSVGLRIQLR